MNDNQSLWYFEDIDMEYVFCPRKMERDHLPQMTINKSEYIYLPQDKAEQIYFIIKGRVKIGTHSESGKEITKAILTEGEVFGELALTGVDKRRDYALALEKTELCKISRDSMSIVLKERSTLHRFFLNLIGDRALETQKRLESLVFKDSRTRIIEFLLDLAEKKGRPVGFEILVKGFMTHQDIANFTATSRQTVTTILNELRSSNILTFDRRRLLIRDLDKLAKAKTV